MLTEAQIKLRKTLISATDVRVLAGLDPYGLTAHDVWASKCLDTPPFEPTEAMMLGNDIEPVVLKHLARKRGIVLVPSTTIVHPMIPHHGATPDALAPVSNGAPPEYGAEVKVTGFRFAREWDLTDEEEGFPEWVLPQVAWGMHCSGAQRWYIGVIIGTMIGTWVVEWKDVSELVDALVEVADRFYVDHVVTKKPPQLDASDGAARMVRELVGKRNNGVMLRASPEAEAAAKMYFEARRAMKETTEKKQEAVSNMIAMIGEADGVKGDGWRALNRRQEGYHVDAYDVAEMRKFDLRPVKR
jgi:predicted phage-related endonuclease